MDTISKNETVYHCQQCGDAMLVPQGSRIRYCPTCKHDREVKGGQQRWQKRK